MYLKLGCVIGNISEDVSGDGETTELKNNENFFFLKKKRWQYLSTGLITHCVPESELGRGDRWGHWSCPHQHTTLPQTETQDIEAYLSLALHFRENLNDTLFILLPKKAIKTETNVIKYWDAGHKIVEFDSFMALADNIKN